MEPVIKLQEEHKFFNAYKGINKITYESVISNTECDSYLKSFFMVLEMENENPNDYNDLINKINRTK